MTIYAMSMINEAASRPETVRISDKTSYETSREFERKWVCHYPRLEETSHDNGIEITQ